MREFPIVRASALSDFLDCAARAEARHLLGKRMPSTGRAVLGTAIHRSTAAYDASMISDCGLTIDETAGAAVDAIYRPDYDVEWGDDESPSDAEQIARALHWKYCAEVAPTQDYVAVEVTCDKLDITDIRLTLTGTTDRVRKTDSGYGISDIKTGKTAVGADGIVSTKGHTFQVGVYELLAEHGSGLPITDRARVVGMQTGKTAKAQRVATGDIDGARDVLIGEPDAPGILEVVAKMIHAGIFPGNPRSMMCHERYCPIYRTCKFRK